VANPTVANAQVHNVGNAMIFAHGKNPPEDAGKHIIGIMKLIARRAKKMQHFRRIKRTSSTVRSSGGKFMSRTNGSQRAFAQIF